MKGNKDEERESLSLEMRVYQSLIRKGEKKSPEEKKDSFYFHFHFAVSLFLFEHKTETKLQVLHSYVYLFLCVYLLFGS